MPLVWAPAFRRLQAADLWPDLSPGRMCIPVRRSSLSADAGRPKYVYVIELQTYPAKNQSEGDMRQMLFFDILRLVSALPVAQLPLLAMAMRRGRNRATRFRRRFGVASVRALWRTTRIEPVIQPLSARGEVDVRKCRSHK